MNTESQNIYFDNATTSWPKADFVARAISEALNYQGSAQRGLDRENSHRIYLARKTLAGHFKLSSSERVVFQPSATQALNLVISDLVKPDGHYYLSRSEHNAVTRPLFYYANKRGARVSWIALDSEGHIKLDEFLAALKEDPADAVFVQQGSNVTGAIQPIYELASALAKSETKLIVDGAQTGGHLEIDLSDEAGIDAWICSGHKGLGGPKGIGLLLLGPNYAPEPLIFGGTGSGGYEYEEASYEVPESLEAGTESLPLIMGLKAAVEDLSRRMEVRTTKERELRAALIRGLEEIEGLKLYGPGANEPGLAIISFSLAGKRADEVSFELKQRFGIASRPGLHCAPALHEFLGTKESGGLVRFGLSEYNDVVEVSKVISAVKMIAAGI